MFHVHANVFTLILSTCNFTGYDHLHMFPIPQQPILVHLQLVDKLCVNLPRQAN